MLEVKSTLGMLAFVLVSLMGGARGVTLMNQIGDASQYVTQGSYQYGASQIYESQFASYDSMALDDFTTSVDGYTVTSVAALFVADLGFEKFEEIEAYQLSIFSTAELAGNGIEGDVASLLIQSGAGVGVSQVNGGRAGLVTLAVSFQLPSAGTYWVGISPVVSVFSSAGSFFLQSGGSLDPDDPGNDNGRFANPGEGHELGKDSLANLNYAYRVEGVPEPSVIGMAAIATGLVVARRRRIFRAKMQV